MTTHDRRGVVGRSVIDDNHFVIRILELSQLAASVIDRSRSVVRADYDRDFWPLRAVWKRAFGESLADCCERALRATITICEAKSPIEDFGAPSMPFVCP